MKMVLYKKCKDIPVYPEFTRILGKNNIPANAPICEDETGMASFLSEEKKRQYLAQLSKGKSSKNWL